SDKPGRTFDSAGDQRHGISPPTDYHRLEKERFAEGIAKRIETAALSNEFEAVGLPVTLFFDARGNHVLSHIGEVTEVEFLNYLTDLKRGRL
ncbi:MAG TPA: host attachment protein, partial [Trueperaceae bacterium]|nr:host attachment protein [Trueperaceae bacterium]